MKTMTFSGRTMREAIAQAKARFGGDVDILDSDAVGDEVQVTVVVPMARYPSSPSSGAGFGQHQRIGRLWSFGRQRHREPYGQC